MSLVNSSLRRIVSGLPWRDEVQMQSMIPGLVERVKSSLENKHMLDPLLQGCFDEIMPNPEIHLTTMDLSWVVKKVTSTLGGPPASRLQFYETLYAMVTKDNCMGTVECMLFDAVFCNVYDDMMLSGDDI